MEANTPLPRWMQADWLAQAPLRMDPAQAVGTAVPARHTAQPSAPAIDCERTIEAPKIPQPADVPKPNWLARNTVTFLAAVLLGFSAVVLLATESLAIPEEGLTVPLPAAEPLVPDATIDPLMVSNDPELTNEEALALNPVEAAAIREAIAADLGSAGYQGPRPAGLAFRGATAGDNERALQCLTQAIYYEAGLEPEAGQRAVAQVILNRVRHHDYPNSICGVVYQGSERRTGCQFTFTCDGALARRPASSIWNRARGYAQQALAGRAFGDVGYATHYHTFEVWPYWGRTLTMTNMIGRHIFHRMRGRGGSPSYFTERYSGRESGPRPWRPRPATVITVADQVLAAQAEAAGIAEEPNNLPPAPVARVDVPVTTSSAPRNDRLPDSGVIGDSLPDSQVRPEFHDSGRWIGG